MRMQKFILSAGAALLLAASGAALPAIQSGASGKLDVDSGSAQATTDGSTSHLSSASSKVTMPQELSVTSDDAGFKSPLLRAEDSGGLFYCGFSESSDLEQFTVIDANRDAKKWEWNSQGFVALMFNQWQAADDWLISPPVELAREYAYTFTVHARPYRGDLPEKIELWAGREPSAEGMTECILPATELTETVWTALQALFTAEEEGTYYFAVRGVSDPDMYALLIDDFAISDGINTNAPDYPEIEVVRDPEGVPMATVNVAVPDKSINGKPLDAPVTVSYYRDGELINSDENVEPGSHVSYIDAEPSVALHSYSVACSNTEGTGPSVSQTVFTGIYYAVWPKVVNKYLGDNEGQVVIEWTPCLEDQLGNPLPEDSVTYDIYRIHGSSVGLLAENVSEPRYVDQVCGEDEEQRQVQYTVLSRTSYGQSAGTGSGIFYAGAPYTLPFKESFADGQLTYAMWSRGIANYAATWDIANMATYDVGVPSGPSDDDGGFAYHYAYNAGETAMIGTAKIAIPENAESAVLKFDTYVSVNNKNTLQVYVDDLRGSVEQLGEAPQEGPACWQTCEFDMLPYAGKTVELQWLNTVNSHILTCIDNIRIDATVIQNSVGSLQNDDSDCEAVYYDLAGRRVSGDSAPGVYVCRKGRSAAKVIRR